MDSFFNRFRNPLMLLALVLAQTIALAMQVPHGTQPASALMAATRQTTLLRYWAVSLVSPFERASAGTGSALGRVWSNYIGLRHLHDRNAALEAENKRLRLEQAAFADDASDGRRLRALLHFQQQYIASTVAAQVIGTSGSDRSRIVTLNKGSDDGLKVDQPVMTPEGIVGKLRYVFPHEAELLLINDPLAGAGVSLTSDRLRGILHGTTDGHVEIGSMTADSRIKVGDAVTTSGGDEVYPRGLPVGTVVSIAPDPEHQPYTAIRVKPAADLQRLDEVLVVTGTQPDMTPAEAADASAADATAANAAAASRRAADLAAERLPGLNDVGGHVTAPEVTVGGVPNVPNSGVPRPSQPLRPDRYSPNTVAPADELKPGARPTSPSGAAPAAPAASPDAGGTPRG